MIEYPDSRRSDLVENLHERQIADPYRWLEDPDASETVDWVRQQNELTESYLSGLDEREWFRETMRAVVQRPQAGVPRHEGGHYFVSRNDGTQAQDVIYVADSLEELLSGGRVIVDPNTWSADGTDSVASFTVSDDGHYFCYNRSEGGSDWNTLVLLDLATGQPVPDAVIQSKFCEAVWLPDNASYLYVDYAHEGHAAGTQTQSLGGARLRRHRVGQPQNLDELILEFPDDDRLLFWPEVSADQQFVVVTIVAGTESRNRLWLYRLTTGLSAEGEVDSRLSAPIKIIDEPRAEFLFVSSSGSSVLLVTDLDAPRSRLVRCEVDDHNATDVPALVEVIGEGPDTLTSVTAAGDQLLAVTLCDAQPRIERYTPDGTSLGIVDVTGGALVELNSRAGDPEAFFGLSSVTSPTTSYRVDSRTGEVRELPGLVAGPDTGFVAPEVTVQRQRATSADGTSVPYFLICPAQVDQTRPQPTLLYGYGGFKVPVSANYWAGWPGWLAAGGVVAIANLRGGGEFGSDWYDDGRLRNKQHVFDDFIAVGEHLVSEGVTTPAQLALHGRSNGGLLVGAVMTQRPDLAAVAVPGVGVLDLLRFHKFTTGAAWVSDYGSPEDPDQFEDLLAYSPLHNVGEGVCYPATLVLTGDHDDRVVPLHSHKFTAALQHAQAGPAPVLTRIEVATGHGLGKPAAMVADEWADLLTFVAAHTGLRPSGDQSGLQELSRS